MLYIEILVKDSLEHICIYKRYIDNNIIIRNKAEGLIRFQKNLPLLNVIFVFHV